MKIPIITRVHGQQKEYFFIVKSPTGTHYYMTAHSRILAARLFLSNSEGLLAAADRALISLFSVISPSAETLLQEKIAQYIYCR